MGEEGAEAGVRREGQGPRGWAHLQVSWLRRRETRQPASSSPAESPLSTDPHGSIVQSVPQTYNNNNKNNNSNNNKLAKIKKNY